jgi:hypothetical protein
MSMDVDCALIASEKGTSLFFDGDDVESPSVADFSSERQRPLDVPEATRKVWHDFLAQHDVAAAILSVTLPGANPQKQAFLIGFDDARNNFASTHRMLAFAERLWTKMEERHNLCFRTSSLSGLIASHSVDASPCRVSEVLAQCDHGAAIQTRHNGAVVRAVYFRKKTLPDFSQKEIASLQLILPLLADSASRGVQLARQSQHSAMLEAMFDRVSLSMMMLSSDSRPLFMNSSASTFLDERNWLIRSADGSIVGTNPKQAKKLRDSVAQAATAPSGAPVEAVHRLDGRDGEWRLAYVLSATSRAGENKTSCALLFILAPGKMDAPTQMLEALGLLPSEQRFLGHFLKSSSLFDAAMDCGLSEETARTYLKRVRAKLGVHRQMELAGLISGLVLPLQASSNTAIEG